MRLRLVSPLPLVPHRLHVLQMVRLLHTLGADINKPDMDGFVPIYVASQEGHARVVELLASLGADVNVARFASVGSGPSSVVLSAARTRAYPSPGALPGDDRMQ